MPSYFGPYTTLEVLRTRRIFTAADRDGNGDVSLDELLAQPEWRRLYKPEALAQLFEAMDSDASGRVSAAELFTVMYTKVDAATRRSMLYWSDPRRTARLAKAPPAKPKPLTARQRQEADAVLATLDSDRDGCVSLPEVLSMVRKNVLGGRRVDKDRKGGLLGLAERPTGEDAQEAAAMAAKGGKGGGSGVPVEEDEVKASLRSWNRADIEQIFHLYAQPKEGTAKPSGGDAVPPPLVLNRQGFHALWVDILSAADPGR